MILKGRYCILEKIGKGGDGSLYLARDMELGVYRAVKEIPISQKKEAKLLRLLSHPAMPAMLDYTEKTEYCYLVMEYIAGQSLGSLAAEGRSFSPVELLTFGVTVSEVLGYLHGRKPPVFYGDLKPDNLMLSPEGKLYLVDFGSAVFGYRRWQGSCRGTRGFAAPEQLQGCIDQRSDIYGLGKTLQALMGKNRFFAARTCPGLLLAAWRCTLQNPALRYQDVKQVQKSLEKILYRKRSGLFRRSVWILAGGLGLLLGSRLLWKREAGKGFWDELTQITEGYYQEDFLKNQAAQRAVCSQAEGGLKQLLERYTGKEEQQKLLLLLAVNAQLQQDAEKSRSYYEQLLLYDEACVEGWGAYGLFLERQGKQKESKALWEQYEEKARAGILEDTDSYTIKAWEEKKNENQKNTEKKKNG